MRTLIFICLLFLGCQKDSSPINDPNAIYNTKGWVISLYSVNNNPSDVFTNYIFEFNDNPAIGCAEWMDGKCPSGVFGGYYDIILNDGLTRFNIILPPSFNLNQITGLWEIVIINSNTIQLKRLNGNNSQLLSLSR